MMELKDMKAFAALTDEERATAIKREEYRLKAIEAYDEETLWTRRGWTTSTFALTVMAT
jgi:hypothetical protein